MAALHACPDCGRAMLPRQGAHAGAWLQCVGCPRRVQLRRDGAPAERLATVTRTRTGSEEARR